jgi:hypothetical protein
MITNSRLLELRVTGLACQEKVDQAGGKSCNMGGPTNLERDYADLFQLVVDEYRLAFLLGK